MDDKVSRILLIEDSAVDALLMEEMLLGGEHPSFEVECVAQLSAGLEYLANESPDLILLDLGLPGSKGLDTFTRVQAEAGQVPIIVLSGLDDESVAVQAVREGAQDYLVKGQVDGNLLTRAIQYAIERKKIEDALRQRTEELVARNEELDAFAHTVAHDLKNPLSLARGFAELLHERHEIMPVEEVSDVTRRIVRSVNKADAILDGLLLLTMARKADLETQPLDMGQIVSEALDRLERMIGEMEAEVILPETWPVAVGYGPWIEEVWVNYVGNALKYGGEHPRVELGAHEGGQVASVSAGVVRFWVRDDGPGIPLEDQARLFMPFERLGRARQEGHGLGLSIVERIVKRLGGQVGVRSQPGQGSTFYFTLPAYDEEEHAG